MAYILSDDEVREAYEKWKRGDGTQQDIADMCHVHLYTLQSAFDRVYPNRKKIHGKCGDRATS